MATYFLKIVMAQLGQHNINLLMDYLAEYSKK